MSFLARKGPRRGDRRRNDSRRAADVDDEQLNPSPTREREREMLGARRDVYRSSEGSCVSRDEKYNRRRTRRSVSRDCARDRACKFARQPVSSLKSLFESAKSCALRARRRDKFDRSENTSLSRHDDFFALRRNYVGEPPSRFYGQFSSSPLSPRRLLLALSQLSLVVRDRGAIISSRCSSSRVVASRRRVISVIRSS